MSSAFSWISENWFEVVKILIPLVSVFLASFYFQRQIYLENRTSQFIQETYLENLHKVESEISNYGTSITVAILDIRRDINVYKDNPLFKDTLKQKIIEIQNRKAINDLLNRDYGTSTEAFPKLHTFGAPLYSAVKNTLYSYSRWTEDLTNYDLLVSQIDANITAVINEKEGLHAIGMILQDTEIYLELRIRQLDDYIVSKNYKTVKSFQNIKEDEKLIAFNKELKEYNSLLKAWDVSQSENKEDRKSSSTNLSKWLSEHIENNPFLDS